MKFNSFKGYFKINEKTQVLKIFHLKPSIFLIKLISSTLYLAIFHSS